MKSLKEFVQDKIEQNEEKINFKQDIIKAIFLLSFISLSILLSDCLYYFPFLKKHINSYLFVTCYIIFCAISLFSIYKILLFNEEKLNKKMNKELYNVLIKNLVLKENLKINELNKKV